MASALRGSFFSACRPWESDVEILQIVDFIRFYYCPLHLYIHKQSCNIMRYDIDIEQNI